MKNFFNEFKKFIFRGNVIDLAVGVIIGSAFTAIVNSLVTDIFTPLISVPSACPRSISEPSAVPSVLPNSTNKTFRLLAGGRR